MKTFTMGKKRKEILPPKTRKSQIKTEKVIKSNVEVLRKFKA